MILALTLLAIVLAYLVLRRRTEHARRQAALVPGV